ncbi:MAG: type II toxin-antitoxin system Phd/YefM family antitoxin [Bryobacteraceae bacterium]
MIDVSQDIHSLTAFKRDTNGLMKRMKKNGRPLVLTVKGRAEAIVLDPVVYQRLAEYHDAVEGIRRGLAQAKKGLGQSVDEVFDEIERG